MKTAKKKNKTLLARVSEVFTKQEPPAPVPVLPPAPEPAAKKDDGSMVKSVRPPEAQTLETV